LDFGVCEVGEEGESVCDEGLFEFRVGVVGVKLGEGGEVGLVDEPVVGVVGVVRLCDELLAEEAESLPLAELVEVSDFATDFEVDLAKLGIVFSLVEIVDDG